MFLLNSGRRASLVLGAVGGIEPLPPQLFLCATQGHPLIMLLALKPPTARHLLLTNYPWPCFRLDVASFSGDYCMVSCQLSSEGACTTQEWHIAKVMKPHPGPPDSAG